MSRMLLETMGLDPAKETPGRQIVRHKGDALVEGMKMALQARWQGHKKLS